MIAKRMPRSRRSFAQGIIFDGVVLSDYFDITELSIKPFPSMSANTVKVPGRRGSRFVSASTAERTLSMKFSLLGKGRDDFSVFDRWSDLVHLLIKDEPKELHIGNGRYIHALALDATELERLGTRGVSTITFTAFDPYFYGETHEIGISSGYNSVLIHGTCAVYPTLSLTGCSGALTIRNVSTADQVVTSSISSSVAKVVVDMEAQRCTVNGSYLAVNMLSTDYFELLPGISQSVYVSSGSGVLSYQEKYL